MAQEEDEWALPDPAALSSPMQADTGGSAGEEPSNAARILERQRDALMEQPGITMVGETLDAVGRPAIMIGVRTAADLRNLPADIEGVPVVGVVTGEIDALRHK